MKIVKFPVNKTHFRVYHTQITILPLVLEVGHVLHERCEWRPLKSIALGQSSTLPLPDGRSQGTILTQASIFQ